MESTRRALKWIGVTIAATMLVIGAALIYMNLPIHQVTVRCIFSDATLSGPKSNKYLEVIAKKLNERGDVAVIKNDRVFSTVDGGYIEQLRKVVLYQVRSEWFEKPPVFETAQQKKIFMNWKAHKNTQTKDAYFTECRLIEAAISKNGIDIEARRNHPDIWPRDKFPIPEDK